MAAAAATLLATAVLPPSLSLICGVFLLSVAYAVALVGRGPHSQPVVAWVPAGFGISVAVAATVGMLAAPFALLNSAGGRWGALVVLVGIPALVGLRRGGRMTVASGQWPTAVVLAGGLVFAAVVSVAVPMEIWTRNVANGTDFSRHLVLMKDVVRTGGLDYAAIGFPRGLHALFAQVSATDGLAGYRESWIALEGLLWLMIVMIATGSAAIGTQVANALRLPGFMANWAVPLMAVVPVLGSMWVSSFFRNGFATSIAAGVILVAAAAAAFDPGWWGSARAALVWSALTLALVHVWPLLAPVVGVLVLLTIATSFSRSTARGAAVVSAVLAAMLALPVVWAMVFTASSGQGVIDRAQQFGNAGLLPPEWWWLVALVSAVVAVFVARHRAAGFSLAWFAMAAAGLLVLLALVFVSGEPWPDLAYYPMKTLWTLSILLPAAAGAGLAWGFWQLWSMAGRSDARLVKTSVQSGLVAVVVLGCVALAGFFAGNRSVWKEGPIRGAGFVPLQILAVDALEQQGVVADPGQRAVVWGLAPYGDARSLEVNGYYDWFASEAMAFHGFYISNDTELKIALLQRRPAQICRFLQSNPDAARITGPNQQAGIPWLRDAGCPEDVIKPDQWVVADVPDQWFTGLVPEGLDYTYPTLADYLEQVEPDASA